MSTAKIAAYLTTGRGELTPSELIGTTVISTVFGLKMGPELEQQRNTILEWRPEKKLLSLTLRKSEKEDESSLGLTSGLLSKGGALSGEKIDGKALAQLNKLLEELNISGGELVFSKGRRGLLSSVGELMVAPKRQYPARPGHVDQSSMEPLTAPDALTHLRLVIKKYIEDGEYPYAHMQCAKKALKEVEGAIRLQESSAQQELQGKITSLVGAMSPYYDWISSSTEVSYWYNHLRRASMN